MFLNQLQAYQFLTGPSQEVGYAMSEVALPLVRQITRTRALSTCKYNL